MSTKQASKLTGADDIRPTTMMIIRRRRIMMMVMMVMMVILREVCGKSKWKFKMAFAIRRPTPPPP